MAKEEPLKLKELLNEAVVQHIGQSIENVWAEFPRAKYEKAVLAQLPELELKQRARKVADVLRDTLPADYPNAAEILTKSLGPELDNTTLEGFTSMAYLPHSEFIQHYGVHHFEASMTAMYELTKRFSAEFCMRPFLITYPDKTLSRLQTWLTDDNCHVRRAVSESTRTRLPWAGRLRDFQNDPTPVIALLEQLKADPELYVRRSVANNLNDIAKDHPDRVLKLLKQWSKSRNAGTDWIIKHATRTLIKDGHPEALELLGYSPNVKASISDFACQPDKLGIGDDLKLSFAVTSEERKPANLMVDFVVHYVKANRQTSPKVFKLAQKSIAPGERLAFSKKLSLQQRTTRKHYPGTHHIEVQLNGQRRGRIAFELTP